MDHNGRKHIALHASNIVNICIDKYDNGEMSGRIYHCYDAHSVEFANMVKMIERVEELFDTISFPQAATKIRSFLKKNSEGQERPKKIIRPDKVVESTEVAKNRGKEQTFLLHVQYRQNSCWQGEVEWVEGEQVYAFLSVLELLKILNNVLEK